MSPHVVYEDEAVKASSPTAAIVVLEGFPDRWLEEEVRTFCRGALISVTGIQCLHPRVEDDGSSVGRAAVHLPGLAAAIEAAKTLRQQKVAGKKIGVTVKDGNGKEISLAPPEEPPAKADSGAAADKESFKTSLCKFWEEGNCFRGADCPYAHGKRERRQRKTKDGYVQCTLHLDEVDMPARPEVDPSPWDREVWVDPLPDDNDLEEFLGNFGEAEETWRVPDSSGKKTDRGYVLFKDHSSAKKCVEAGTASWSESERALMSQSSARRGDRERWSTYPTNVVAGLLGHGGDVINKMKADIGARTIHLGGEGLKSSGKWIVSKRLHLSCEADCEDGEILTMKFKLALQEALISIHDQISVKLRSEPHDARRKDVAPPESADFWKAEGIDINIDTRPWRPPWVGPNVNGKRPPPEEIPLPHGHWWPPPPAPWGFPPPHPWGWPPPPGHGWHPPPMHPPPGSPPPPGAPPPGPPPPGAPPPAAPPPPGDYYGGHPHNGPNGAPGGFPARPSSASDHPADGPSGDDFLQSLPNELSPRELDLAEAVANFLGAWADKSGDSGKKPSLAHLGADAQVRQLKSAAMPREVALRDWLECRLAGPGSTERAGGWALVLREERGKIVVEFADGGAQPLSGPPRQGGERNRERSRSRDGRTQGGSGRHRHHRRR